MRQFQFQLKFTTYEIGCVLWGPDEKTARKLVEKRFPRALILSVKQLIPTEEPNNEINFK